MKRYWLANSSETPPSPPSSTVGGYPQDGNIALNHKPTKVGAWWYHMITEEFMAVIERAGLTPSHENLHQLADIFDDFKQRAQGAETFKDQAVAAANRAEAAAGQVVTDVAGAIAQVQAATDAEIARLNTRAGEVETSTSTGLTNLQNKLTELIANLEQVGGEQAAYVISQAQEILDTIIPPQTGQSGKVLGTDGTSASWITVPSDDTKLDKSGGTVTGAIELPNEQGKITFPVNDGNVVLRVSGDADTLGVSFVHEKSDNTKRVITAFNTSRFLESCILEATTEVGTNFIRYSSGLQVCFFSVDATTTAETITYPKAFVGDVIVVTGQNFNGSIIATKVSATSCEIRSTSNSGTARIVVFGKWK